MLWCSRMQYLIVVVLVCLVFVAPPALSVTDPGDVNVLHKLQRVWGGDTLLWSGTSDPCADRWTGVICDATNSRVTSLYLVSRRIVGEIPPELGSLSALQNLDLSFNGLTGQLPPELGSLTNLLYLSVQSCNISGPIPAFLGKLVNLTFFALNNNQLNGPIPSSLGAIKQLRWFDVAYNRLTGPLPVSTTSSDKLGLDTWPVVEHLHLNDNAFSGTIPTELGRATKCKHLLLERNAFSGSIPESLGNLSSLQILNLNNNQLNGSIPTTLNKIKEVGTTYTGLHQIRVSNNLLTGTVPNFKGLNKLEYVDFSNNSFDPQPFPGWLNASSSILQTIKFENGNLIGSLPTDILSYPALEGLFLQDNQINGTLRIPENLGEKLLYVYLKNNSILSVDQASNNTKLPEIQLQGNPVCTGAGISTANPIVCNAFQNPIATQWTSPLVMTNNCQACKDSRLTLNPYTCFCSVPLIVTLQVREPIFTRIDDETLWKSLKGQTYDSLANLTAESNPPLKLVASQIWVRDASYNGSFSNPQVRLFFFPETNVQSLVHTTVDFIKMSFTTQRIHYLTPFKPQVVIEIIFALLDLLLGVSTSPGTPIWVIAISVLGGVVSLIISCFCICACCR